MSMYVLMRLVVGSAHSRCSLLICVALCSFTLLPALSSIAWSQGVASRYRCSGCLFHSLTGTTENKEINYSDVYCVRELLWRFGSRSLLQSITPVHACGID